jgi:hypothetical protein
MYSGKRTQTLIFFNTMQHYLRLLAYPTQGAGVAGRVQVSE